MGDQEKLHRHLEEGELCLDGILSGQPARFVEIGQMLGWCATCKNTLTSMIAQVIVQNAGMKLAGVPRKKVREIADDVRVFIEHLEKRVSEGTREGRLTAEQTAEALDTISQGRGALKRWESLLAEPRKKRA